MHLSRTYLKLSANFQKVIYLYNITYQNLILPESNINDNRLVIVTKRAEDAVTKEETQFIKCVEIHNRFSIFKVIIKSPVKVKLTRVSVWDVG